MVKFRSGMGLALNLSRWKGLTESPPPPPRVSKRASQGKRKHKKPQKNEIAVLEEA